MTLLFVYLGIALIFSFFCSIFEAVFLSINSPFVDSLKRTKPRTARMWTKLREKPNRPLAAILILNTIAHTMGSVGVGAQAEKVFPDMGAGWIGAITTVLILVLSEIIPKTLGSTYWRSWAGWVGRGISFFHSIFFWTGILWLSEKITNLFGKGHGLTEFSRDEMAAMVELGGEEGHLTDRETQMLRNLVRVRRNNVSDVMTPRTVVFKMQQDMTAADFIEGTLDCPFSRVPIFGGTEDEVTGFVLRSEIAVAGSRPEGGSKRISEFKRDIITVQEEVTLLEMFDKFLAERQHIAIVVDEFGAGQGIVTLEDVVETMLGMEIVDESDQSIDMQAHARELWRQRAKSMGIDPPERDAIKGGNEVKPGGSGGSLGL